MDNNAMQQQQNYDREPIAQQAWHAAKELGGRAATAAGQGITKVADATEDTVRKYPLAAVGIALGTGIALGALVTGLAMPRRKSLADRIGELDVVRGGLRLFRRVF
jgi:ElaB/YqjD/DUF883 family membrane-anchored ribosome-binding protein